MVGENTGVVVAFGCIIKKLPVGEEAKHLVITQAGKGLIFRKDKVDVQEMYQKVIDMGYSGRMPELFESGVLTTHRYAYSETRNGGWTATNTIGVRLELVPPINPKFLIARYGAARKVMRFTGNHVDPQETIVSLISDIAYCGPAFLFRGCAATQETKGS